MDAQVPLPSSRGRTESAGDVPFPPAWLRGFPWWPLPDALRLLRIVTALLFMAHASMRFVYGSIAQFAWAMENVHGFHHGKLWVLAITFYELGAGSLLLLDRGVRWAASGLAVIVSVGIYLIHRHNGWFVGEHGTGGSEYSVALLAMLLVLASHDAARASTLPLPDRKADPA